MDAACFQKGFVEQLLPNIKPRSVIVMDNASYHSAQVEKVPSSSSRKADIQCWLKSKSIPFSDDYLKSELLQLVKQNKHMFLAYQIDTLASAAGHEVVRLPPYHCELNPIELVWSQRFLQTIDGTPLPPVPRPYKDTKDTRFQGGRPIFFLKSDFLPTDHATAALILGVPARREA
ncbi:hypothetical protein HPB50_010944 [Hyalomma asiaticum]|uniref:Uncharacterized protein n=1 Tax=Hyalomma asiaticum TaxID=266040 RepID=A0ACB7SXE4_HYAAI|nr:hypothetical protein HPB50_010944 [Hyalomma asiaticum]